MLPSEIRPLQLACPSEPPKREGASPKRTHAAKAELPFEHSILAHGRGARVLEHDRIGVKITSLVLIGLVPAARLTGGVAVCAAEAAARAHTR